MRRSRGLVALFCAAVGCGHGRGADGPNESVRLRSALAESQGREVDLQRRVDELQNRIFLLEDQLESQVLVSKTRAPARLPLDANADAPVIGDVRPGRSDDEIEYAGDASNVGAPRPMLRLSGQESPARRALASAQSASVGTSPAQAGLTTGDRLAVIKDVPPLPPSKGSSGTPTTKAAPPVMTASAAGVGGTGIAAMKLYQSALEQLHQHAHPKAISQFEQFLQQYPRHDYADNAQYWLGECYYDQKDFARALREFRRVIQQFPNGNKAPDALLKVGLSYGRLEDRKNQRDVLEQVMKSYPGTEVAKKAAETLEAMK